MTGYCYDLPGPKDQLVVATSKGWVPFDERAAAKMAASAMMLACGPEHAVRLRQELEIATAKPLPDAHTVASHSR